MPTNSSAKHKKKAPPPPPAMFQLYAPVHAFGAAAAEPDPPADAVQVEDKSNAATATAAAGEGEGEGEGKKNPPEGDKDSIAGGTNAPLFSIVAPSDPDKAPPEDAANDEKGAADPPKKSATDRLFLDSDTSEDEGGVKIDALPPKHFSQANKCPRGSGTVEEYARRVKERERREKAGGGTTGSKSPSGEDNAEGGGRAAERKSGGRRGKNSVEGNEEGEKTRGIGGVKTKSTPRLPNDLPPPPPASPSKAVKMKKTPRIPNPSDLPPTAKLRGKVLPKTTANRRGNEPPKKKTTAGTRSSRRNAGGGGDLKSPPEETVPDAAPLARRTKAGGLGGGKGGGGEKVVQKGQSKKRSASVMAEELISNLENADDVESSAAAMLEEEESGARRSKRARLPSVAAEEAQSNQGAAMAIRAIRAFRSPATKKVSGESKEEPSPAVAAAATKKRSAPEPKKPSSGPKSSKRSKSPSPSSSDSSTSSSSSDADSTSSPEPTKKAAAPRPKATKKKGKKVKVKVGKELTPRQLEYLEEKRSKTWASRIAMLTEYKNKYNTCSLANAPAGSIPAQLRNFVGETRKQYKYYKRGEVSSMTPERIEELEKLGFDFNPLESDEGTKNRSIRFESMWDDMFLKLEAYRAVTGNCLVTSMAGTDYQMLGNWVRGQRKLMNKVGRDGFPPRRLAKLESVGFDFDPVASGQLFVAKRENSKPKLKITWEKHYKDFVKFKQTHGHIIVGPKSHNVGRLYDWIHLQRKEYKKFQAGEKANMRPEWIAKLEELGFDWAPMSGDGFSKMLQERQKDHYEVLWQKRFQEIVEFKQKHGHCHPSRTNGVKDSLAGWVHVQRKHKRRHDKGEQVPINKERIKLLDDIGFDWNPGRGTMLHRGEDNWEAVFQKLVAYKKTKGHCNPKKKDPNLGSWTSRMRGLYKKNKRGVKTSLTDERIAKLMELGFVFE